METKEHIWAEGISFNKPREGAPEFVKGHLAINIKTAIPFLERYANTSGYVNIDMKKSKEKGTIYLELNQWQPTKKEVENINDF